MHTKPDPIDPKELETMGFDRRDINVPSIKKSTIWITVGCFACFIIAWPIYNYFTIKGPALQSMMGKGRTYDDKSKIRITAPNPVLQDNITTKVDIEVMRQRETGILTSAGWVDQSKGQVRIPIEDAKRLIAERGVETGNAVVAKVEGNTITQNATGPKAK
jgi:hypothetical protein